MHIMRDFQSSILAVTTPPNPFFPNL
ncbi:hypothetical protein XFF6166_340002 [Xanthomonas citri pv. fuscans]|uniref:Uncharacterized protein n=1 Tax=Xanthomonas campestris pv. phaseoli TaxID=317013 RepID=A0A7Z7J3S6_XANCH|nr:hypothetical protein XFF6166_340002 [Xanthomonas citri pv. fuscans]SOO26832.1 hypothetical protein XFF6991_60016 [Xanthomonas phaseoli pv. phaseoli]SOO02448.1 hypothetical protein XFF6960_620002 [Xanthomonas citri pv. fuscans]SOO06076.1 hypothetical protein XFF7767_620002 [Xanthomonas citri pv. fuscans]SOO09819.1 hypothetical protein XFF6970_470011 [Xanthomonas citri pv. fuscans]